MRLISVAWTSRAIVACVTGLGLLAVSVPARAQSSEPASAPQAQSQTASPKTPPATSADQQQAGVPLSPEALARMRQAVARPSIVSGVEGSLPTFRAEVIAGPDFHTRLDEFMKSTDLRYGPVKGAGMTHAEFVGMVTPKELYGSGGISPTELLQAALVNWAAHAAIGKIREWRAAQEAAQIEAIRQRIDRELAALRGGGR